MNLFFDLEGTLLNSHLPGHDWGALLSDLSQSHCLYVVTSKSTRSAEESIEKIGWKKYFLKIIGREFYTGSHSKTETVAFLIERENLDDGTCVMIGDRPHDMEAGRGNSICSVGVLWGNGTRAELLEAGADYLCATAEELKTIIEFLAEPGEAE